MMASRDARPCVLFLFTEVFANGGIQRFNQTILDACVALGINCRVMSLNDLPALIEKQPERHHLSVVGFSGHRRKFAIAVLGTLLRGRYNRVVIGHINLLTLTIAVLTLRRFHRASTMLVAHGIEIWSGIGSVRRSALSRTDRILCVSHYTRQRLLEQAPALAGRTVIFPNALAASWSRVAPVPSSSAVPARFILSVTRLDRGDRYKGIATVIEAFSMLADDSMQYFIIGDGNDLPFLQLVAERFGVKDRVHFMRGVSDSELIALYRTCQAFVLPSGKEGFGIVFLEAMFFGAPVIAAHEKGAMDVVRNGESGIAVRFGDTIAIKEAIERIGSDIALREHMCANAQSLVVNDGPFTFARFTQRCAAVFELSETPIT
jgi:phosphatidylinositol alpha-1,6-mannosyltransferase